MRVILKDNIENLGHTGDIVNVKDGYARNFLIPRNLVAVADQRSVNAFEHHKKKLEVKRLAQRAVAQEVANKLGELQVTITKKVGESDKLYGSVTSQEISDALAKLGQKIDKKMIRVDDAIKTLGVHSVQIKLDTEVTGTLKVSVVKEA